MKNSWVKVDLHVHSRASNRPGGWFTQLIGCPESFAKPIDVYKKLKERGMAFITITDHDTIDGVLEIAHLPEVFIGAEYTVTFPEENTSVHVLVYGLDEKLHEELLKLRENVYHFVAFLKEKNLPHTLAHPLYPVSGGRISDRLVEKFVLLFDNWEVINGSRGERLRAIEEAIARRYDGWDRIHLLEEKHNICSLRCRESIAFTAGSDDHGGFDAGRTWTEALASNKEELFEAIRQGNLRVSTDRLGYERLLNTVSIVGYHYLSSKNKLPQQAKSLLEPLFKQSESFLFEVYVRNVLSLNGNRDQWLKEILHRLPGLTLPRLSKDLSPQTLGENMISLLLHFLPLIILSAQRRDELQAEELAKSFDVKIEKPKRLAYVTDTYFDINGVAKSTQMVRKIADEFGLAVDILVVGKGRPENNLRYLAPLREVSCPYYPEFKLRVPSIVELAEILKDYTQVHVATPGPFGLLAFLVGKLLHLPVTTAYHTDVPAYAYHYTKNLELMNILYKMLVLYHNLSDKVYVPSRTYAQLLIEKGVKPEKIRIFTRGVDTKLFSPAQREEGFYQRNFGIPVKGKLILYVGRVSKEKNLDLFLSLARCFPDETFVVVGDGPYRAELEAKKTDNLFTLGYLTGQTLAKAYASADVFLFPSETETYGFVVLEAMASWLPVIVSSKGASSEHVKDGFNGFVAGSLEEYASKLQKILSDETLRQTLAQRGLAQARALDLSSTYLDYLTDLLGTEERDRLEKSRLSPMPDVKLKTTAPEKSLWS